MRFRDVGERNETDGGIDDNGCRLGDYFATANFPRGKAVVKRATGDFAFRFGRISVLV
jgi:hypothetical protein